MAALKKRWRVDCGVKPPAGATEGYLVQEEAKLMAVPFRAKDVAAERTEFGHPDMAIVLTHLSYYYSGLNDDQLLEVFKILKDVVTGPEAVYNMWIRKLPQKKITSDTIRSYRSVNLQDYEQRVYHLFPLLRRHKDVVDFWLENVVFPKECKQFPRKLVTNAWDLCYERGSHPTTGFSGTNDTSLLLPAQISQRDLAELMETNKQMERILTGAENKWGRSLKMGVGCEQVIRFMVEDGLKVLIDAGAIMLELGNEAIAELWMEVDTNLEGVVYFNEDNEMVIKVKRQEGQRGLGDEKDQSLNMSSFKESLQNCAIYLDDQHTRGTDIKLPTHFKACVTVGSGMRRDKLVQACMRMRKLGKGQTVHFYLSHEVNKKICGEKDINGRDISVMDILKWVKGNSKRFEEEGLVYWAANARSYAQKIAADEMFEEEGKGNGELLGKRCEDSDGMTLKGMYGAYHKQQLLVELVPQWFERVAQNLMEMGQGEAVLENVKGRLKRIEEAVMKKCKKHIPEKYSMSCMMDEEQEKELEPEQEEEVERQIPAKEEALTPHLHENVRRLVVDGDALGLLEGVARLSKLFRRTGIRLEIQENGWGGRWFASEDFIETVKGTEKDNMDQFLRPMKYFVSFGCDGSKSFLMISQYEVDQLIRNFRGGSHVATTLHMFTGRWMDGQDTFANNVNLQLPLNRGGVLIKEGDMAPLLIASGNLFFHSMKEQLAFAKFLGLRLRPWRDQDKEAFEQGHITGTGFVMAGVSELIGGGTTGFENDPTGMVREILKMRNFVLRDTDHVVKILDSCALLENWSQPQIQIEPEIIDMEISE